MILSLLFFTFSFIFYVVAALLYTGHLVFKKRWLGQSATAISYIALASTTLILIFRAIESKHAPFANLFESMTLFVWATNIGYLVLEYKHKQRVIGVFVMFIESLAMLAAALLPYKFKSAEPLNPALQSKWHWMQDLLAHTGDGMEQYAIGWLDFHVFSTFIGYGAFAISFGIGIMYLLKMRSEERERRNAIVDMFPDSNMLDELGYRAIAWGFPFLTIGIISGAVWADYAWGTYWSWDPKETWSLITWLIYAAYLHARVTRGWRGKRAAWLSIAGFLAIIFLYWGVSFILPGLHAYA
ncbi:MAG: c-type cytochrome biogenesis protein CcsB [Deltaproteobacteria bacterium RIFCSPLOWO2_02_FULL_53_8]|nr:MAG: c-type cytochrome biogenesis protein CcsB [Deltaproteobacteria bacterium RIFCSPLOWO2_02_FULL_53_8]